MVGERARKPEPWLGPPSAVRGQRLFADNCAICHGTRGDGHGTRTEGLTPAPPDFTNLEWQATHSIGSVRRSIREGVPDTQMPSWQVLGNPAIDDLAAFVKSRGPKE